MRRGFFARWLRRLGVAFFLLALLGLSPIAYVETQCKTPPDARVATLASPYKIDETGYRRAEGDSYLTYPEWYIVHAYADLAALTRQSSESAFDYLSSIAGFWRSLCGATIAAGKFGDVTADQKTTNYIIGVSFTAEMGLIGAYERTLGALTAWARGPQRTGEDEFALALADDYAAFLQQTPWYRYPFWPKLGAFWRDTPWGQGNLLRGAERRFALSLEYGAKGLYAKGIAWLAGLSPADLTIYSVTERLSAEDLAADRRIKLMRVIGADASLIETPRYREYTDILRRLAGRGRSVLEIAGNRHILVTVIAPEGLDLKALGGAPIFALPIQSRPGWRRLGLDVDVMALTRLIGAVEGQGAEFEHAYDY